MKLTIIAAILGVFLTGCATQINRHNASNYYDAGLRAELAGDYVLAERNYERALINARLGNAPDAGVSAAMYSVGRMKGILCKFGEAEPLLLESLKLEEGVSGTESAITSKRLFELARFYSDRGMYDKSLPYFSRGIPVVVKLGVESSDPIALADVYDEYAVALERSGQRAEAEKAKASGNALRAKNPGKKANFIPVRYVSKCASK
jgi:tetratricopeptide (TPR) repeat protein